MISAAAVMQGLFSTAVGRVVPSIYQRVARRSKVDAAMRGAKHLNTAIETAMRDFEVIIGSTYGDLTESLDKFLRELETTGIAVIVAEEAITKARTTITRKAFASLHDSIFGVGVGDSDVLLEKIYSSFEASFEALFADPALALLFRSLSSDIAARLERIEQKIGGPGKLEAATRGHDELIGDLVKISRAINTNLKYIRVETNRGAKLVQIDKIYIPSKLRPRLETGLLEELASLDPGSRFMHRGSSTKLATPSDQIIRYSDFRGSFQRAVILGDPGGGKSTLCQYLCHNLARQFALAHELGGRRGSNFEAQQIKVPIRIVLRSFESGRLKEPQLSIFDFIVRDLQSSVNLTPPTLIESLRYALNLGLVVLAFDGLDEILSTGTRREFVDLVISFCDQYPLCPVFVTSRLVGYENAPLSDDFEQLTLEKFDRNEVQSYVQKYLKVFSGMKNEQAAGAAKKFLDQTERNAGDLRQNPLMLGLMAFLFANHGDVPSNRPEIYRECAIMMFEKWDQNRNIRADIPAGFDMLDLFSEISASIYGDPELEDGVSKQWIIQKNRDYFMSIYEDRAKSYEASRKVAEFITGRSWVMSEFGPEIFRFSHRTFMEYFFARHLDQQNETVTELFVILLPKILENQWDVISHLALQLKTFRRPRRTTQALENLSAAIQSHNGDILKLVAVSSFMVKALHYLLPTEAECRRSVSELIEATNRTAASKNTRGAATILEDLQKAVPERREFMRSVIADEISKVLIHGKPENFEFWALMLTDQSELFYPFGRMDTLDEEISVLVRRNIRTYVGTEAKVDPFFANLFWEWYSEDFDALFAVHRFAMFTVDRRPWSGEIRHVATPFLRLLARISRYFSESSVTEEAHAAAKHALAVIGKDIDPSQDVRDFLGPDVDRLILPPQFWGKAIRDVQKDKFALRGLAFIWSMTSGSTTSPSPDKQQHPSGAPIDEWVAETSSLFRTAIGRIARVSDANRELFRKWLD